MTADRIAVAVRSTSITPTRIGSVPVSVERATILALAAVGGVDIREGPGGDGIEILESANPKSLVFRWTDRDDASRVLELPFLGGLSPFVALRRIYGMAAVRDLLTIYFFAWARGARAEEMWWWPSEHLDVCRLRDSRENRSALVQRISHLSRTRLEVRYATGKPLVGPIVRVGLTDGSASKIALHDALYTGIRDRSGKRGRWFWPLPLELLRLPADRSAGEVHILGPVLGSIWRSKLSAGEPLIAEIGAGVLADRLGIRGRRGTGRRRDARAAETLRRTLEAARSCGLVASWSADGLLESLAAKLSIEAGAEARGILASEACSYPPCLPATGAEFSDWLSRNGLSVRAAGGQLRVSWPTLARAARYGDRPLPQRVRDSLRRLLWVAP